MVIGKLNVLLGLNSAQFNSGMAAAKTQIATFSASLTGMSGAMAAIGFVAGGVTAVFSGIRTAASMVSGPIRTLMAEMERMHDLGRQAQRIGITTEALVGLSYAAEMTSTQVGALEPSLIRMQKNLAEAAAGAGGARDALAELNLDPVKLVGMAPDKAFMAIADALSGVTLKSERLRLTLDLFGKSGSELITLLDEGADGIAKLRAEAEELGITFSQLDADKAEAAADAMKNLANVWGALKQELAIDIAPFFSEWLIGVQLLIEDIKEFKNQMHGLGFSIRQGVRQVFGMQTEWDNQPSKMAEEAADKARQAAAAQEEYNRRLAETQKIAEKARLEIAQFIATLENDVEFTGLLSAERKVEDAWAAGKFDVAGFMDFDAYNRAMRAADQLDQMQRDMEEFQRRSSEHESLISRGASLTDSLMTPMEAFSKRQADANRLLQAGAISWQTYGREIAAAREELIKTQSVQKGPALIERGSQEDYASGDAWRSRSNAILAANNRGEPPALIQRLEKLETVMVKVEENTRSTSTSSRRTAVAVERTETPEVVDM